MRITTRKTPNPMAEPLQRPGAREARAHATISSSLLAVSDSDTGSLACCDVPSCTVQIHSLIVEYTSLTVKRDPPVIFQAMLRPAYPSEAHHAHPHLAARCVCDRCSSNANSLCGRVRLDARKSTRPAFPISRIPLGDGSRL